LAQTGGWSSGRACPLCPGTSDINLFRYCESIVHLDTEISDCAFDLGVTKQKLDSPAAYQVQKLVALRADEPQLFLCEGPIDRALRCCHRRSFGHGLALDKNPVNRDCPFP
jgi:hypothetical protein